MITLACYNRKGLKTVSYDIFWNYVYVCGRIKKAEDRRCVTVNLN